MTDFVDSQQFRDTFVDGGDNIRLVSALEYEWDDGEAEFVKIKEDD